MLGKYLNQLRESQEQIEKDRPSVERLIREITDKDLLKLVCNYIPKKKQAQSPDVNHSKEEELIKTILTAQDEDLLAEEDDEEFETTIKQTQT